MRCPLIEVQRSRVRDQIIRVSELEIRVQRPRVRNQNQAYRLDNVIRRSSRASRQVQTLGDQSGQVTDWRVFCRAKQTI